MKMPAAADLQRWSDEVARDPGSLAFLPLARAYRRQGQHDAALRLCLKGLERHSNHVEAHALLALLYVDRGDRTRAADEWAVVLRLDPSNFDALRGLGFCYLDAGELSQARHHLERAALARPGDPAVRDALRLIRERVEAAAELAGFERSVPASPPAPSPAGRAAALTAATATVMGEAANTPPPARDVGLAPMKGAVPTTANGSGYHPPEPASLFDAFMATGPLLGAVLIDARGLVLAGRLGDAADADALGALMSAAIAEVARTVLHLELGTWHGMLLETESALVHVSQADAGAAVVLAARSDAPTGWVVRTASQACGVARHFLGGRT